MKQATEIVLQRPLSGWFVTTPGRVLAAFALAVIPSTRAFAQGVDQFTVGTYEAVPGTTITIPIEGDFSAPIEGYVASVAYDSTLLELLPENVSFDGAAGGVPPEFTGIVFVAGGEGELDKVVVAFIAQFSTSGPPNTIPPGQHLLCSLTMTVLSTAAVGTSTPLNFEDLPNNDPIYINEIVRDGEDITANPNFGIPLLGLSPGSLNIVPFIFRRGDIDGNNLVALEDAMAISSALFIAGAAALGCLEAADVNADGTVDIRDPVWILWWIFRQGLPPETPFPDCGGPVIEQLGCEVTSPCS